MYDSFEARNKYNNYTFDTKAYLHTIHITYSWEDALEIAKASAKPWTCELV